MEACLTFGQFLLPMALCWQRVEESNNQPKLHRLHLVLTDAPKYNPRYRNHPAYPGGSAIGLLWGYALNVKTQGALALFSHSSDLSQTTQV